MIKEITKKLGERGLQKFQAAASKGIVGGQGQSGLKRIVGVTIRGISYLYEIKVLGEFGGYRIFGYLNDVGTIIFDYFGKHL